MASMSWFVGAVTVAAVRQARPLGPRIAAQNCCLRQSPTASYYFRRSTDQCCFTL